MSEILGEEAELAYCENCGIENDLDHGVVCEACGLFFCRKICWSGHWCDELTDRDGKIVREGTVVIYSSHPDRAYVVVEIPGTFKRGGIAYGQRLQGRRTEEKTIIHPRLMYVAG